MLRIYNSLTKQKEEFTPILKNKVNMYVCGMTVYDLCHVGHARVLVFFDLVSRYLRDRGYEVTYVRNITDIDDKIINRAQQNNESIDDLTNRFINAMHEDAAELSVLPPDQEPRATQSMPEIISMIEILIKNGFAYQANNGDVYFDVSQFPSYGKLSGRQLDDLKVGARVETDEAKDDPLDFVLWKAAKKGEPSWSSQWGEGRPGWHIECSAMSTCCLGNHFDIHGGGMDLMFPHHENEVAQSEASTGETFVNYWMHIGFVNINDEKMSKSMNNFFTVREVLKYFQPEVVRYFILSSHYRSPLNYSQDNLKNSQMALERFYSALRGVADDIQSEEIDRNLPEVRSFHDAMCDDFNTPEALAVMFDLVKKINILKTKNETDQLTDLVRILKYMGNVLGLLMDDASRFLQRRVSGIENGADGMSDDQIESLVADRALARERKDWAESDRLRDELQRQGISLEDAGGKTIWRRSGQI